ncbi:hypothetical protein DN550_32015, partial [Burkholderia multivorans]
SFTLFAPLLLFSVTPCRPFGSGGFSGCDHARVVPDFERFLSNVLVQPARTERDAVEFVP